MRPSLPFTFSSMNRFHTATIAILIFSACTIPLVQGKTRKAATRSTAHKNTAHVSKSRMKATGHAGVHSKRGARGRQVAKSAPASSWRSRQLAPSSDRYREIQEALVSKGYLKSTPTGTWDADSQDAMRRFQADQKLEGTGKINSLSLIALGLGPAKTTEPAVAVQTPEAPKP